MKSIHPVPYGSVGNTRRDDEASPGAVPDPAEFPREKSAVAEADRDRHGPAAERRVGLGAPAAETSGAHRRPAVTGARAPAVALVAPPFVDRHPENRPVCGAPAVRYVAGGESSPFPVAGPTPHGGYRHNDDIARADVTDQLIREPSEDDAPRVGSLSARNLRADLGVLLSARASRTAVTNSAPKPAPLSSYHRAAAANSSAASSVARVGRTIA